MKAAAEEGRMDLRMAWRHTQRAVGIIHERYPGYLALSGLNSFIQAIQPLTILYLSALVLDQLSGARNVQTIVLYVGITVFLTFILSVARSIIERRLAVTESTFYPKMYFCHSEKYMGMDFSHVDKSSTNELLADIEAKIDGNDLGIPTVYYAFPRLAKRLFGLTLSVALLSGLFRIAGAYAHSLATSPMASIGLTALILFSMVFTFNLRQREHAKLKELLGMYPFGNSVGRYYHNYVGASEAAKDIRLYAQQPAVAAIISKLVYAMPWQSYFHYEAKVSAATSAANAISGGCVYLFIGLRAVAGMYSIGNVLRYIGAVSSLVDHATGLINECSALVANSLYLESTYQYLDLPGDRHHGTLTTEKRLDNEYEIEFRNVSFIYPGSNTYALKDLSLKLIIGRRLAVVGMNGSGKTTMIKLLCRLHDPTEGVITLNGIDIRKYDYSEYINLFSVVFQDFKLFSLPLGQNVAASMEVDAGHTAACLEKAGFTDRLRELPHGLDTCLNKDFDPDGVSISGGEAQKIALARALYKSAPFIVLDEPTAALDPIAEFEVYSRFDEIIENRTAVYISHRLASCRFCDDIAVFHEGHLVQCGNHEQLLAEPGGKYRELWNAQAQHYTDPT